MHRPSIQRHIRRAIWILFWFSPIIVAKMDADVVQGISPASSVILDVQGPGLEPPTDYENSLLSRRYRILFYANDDEVQYARSIYMIELLRLYGIITQHG